MPTLHALMLPTSIGLILLLTGCAPPAPHAAPDPDDASDAVPVEVDDGTHYQPTLEQAFGMIARHEAEGFAGMRWEPEGPLRVFVAEGGDEDASVDAALRYLERSAVPDTPPLPGPENVVVERVRHDADQLWRWWGELRRHWQWGRLLQVDWTDNIIVLAFDEEREERGPDLVERFPPGPEVPSHAWELRQADRERPDRTPEPRPYPFEAIPQDILADPAFMCRWAEQDAESPRDSLAFSLEVVTERPTADRPVRFRAVLENVTDSAFRLLFGNHLFEAAVRDSAGAGIGMAPTRVTPAEPVRTGEFLIVEFLPAGFLPLCPGQRHSGTLEWDPRTYVGELIPGRYQAELWLGTRGETLEGLDSIEFYLAPPR